MNMLLETAKDTAATATKFGWVNDLVDAIFNILNPVLILVAVAGIIYAIVVGVKFAKAEDKSQRDEAKQKLITVIIGIVVTAVLIALFYWLSQNIGDWITTYLKKDKSHVDETTGATINFIRTWLGK